VDEVNLPNAPVTMRPVNEEDEAFLVDMTTVAVNWDRPVLTREDVLAIAELNHYAVGWGRHGDVGVVALVDGQGIGAAWVRLFHPAYPGYGFVSGGIPELTMAVVAGHRGAGVGAALLDALLGRVEGEGFHAVSLSVARRNRALHLYGRAGFVVVEDSPGTTAESLTMVLTLPR
jgi:GNAT superfamily N-acetyltransferase